VKNFNRDPLLVILVSILTLAATLDSASAQTVKLRWEQSTSTSISSNNVYRGNTSGGPYSEIFEGAGPIVKYTDAAVVDGETYCWVVTAVASRIESPYSNEVCKTITTQAPAGLTAR
jgi:fibronectin type 3 domain-containing protein